MSNFLSNPNVRRGMRAVALATAVSVGAAACSGPDQAKPAGTPCDPVIDRNCDPNSPYTLPKKVPGTLSTEKPATTTILSEEQIKQKQEQYERDAVKKYIDDAERNTALNDFVQNYGGRIVSLAEENGKFGYFDFYNGQKNAWKSKGQDVEGWGYLQHNPQYGGNSVQVSVGVYMGADGKVDLSKGVKSLDIYDQTTFASFNAPDSYELLLGSPHSEYSQKGWEVGIGHPQTDPSGNKGGLNAQTTTYYEKDATVDTMKMIDFAATQQTSQLLDPIS